MLDLAGVILSSGIHDCRLQDQEILGPLKTMHCLGSSLRSLCHSYSFAPPGLAYFPLGTHGLRRGLHSYAASRL
jgi:hypothetical protein